MSGAYYNEFDLEAAEWLRNNIKAGLVAPGIVDTRSIIEVQPDDLRGFTQHHFFAGIGGWSYAARLAGWPDERPIWSGSCPCQPFSAAGRQLGTDDPRHLWPDLYRLWRAFRPPVGVGEQVAGAAGYGWFDGVRADLAREGFASRVVDIPALAVDAPHQRNRLYWVALVDAESERRGEGQPESELRWGGQPLPAQIGEGVTLGDAFRPGLEGQRGHGATVAEDGRNRIDQLPRQMAATWCTPAAHGRRAAKRYLVQAGQPPAGANLRVSLTTGMRELQITGATEAGGLEPTGSSATTARRVGSPTPAHPCWLMGFPIEFLHGAVSVTRSSRRSLRK
jgi:site-specific DNA-cytosine methylase